MKKLNGYRTSHRNKWFFIQNGILSIQELSLLEFYADIFDFDKHHQSFGKFPVNFEEIAAVFNCSSPNTVRNWHGKLLKLGFIKRTEAKNIYELSCFLRYISPGVWQGKAAEYAEAEKDQTIGNLLQNFGIDLQQIENKVQNIGKEAENSGTKSPSIALGSFKGESGFIKRDKVETSNKLRTKQDYQKMHTDNPDGLTPDDMRWIDENLVEEVDTEAQDEEEV